MKQFAKFFEYKYENLFEKAIVEKYFKIEHLNSTKSTIYYSILGTKELRKIKLLLLKQDETAIIIQKILTCSKETNISDLMEWKLSAEIAEGIDREIINKLKSYSSNPVRYI